MRKSIFPLFVYITKTPIFQGILYDLSIRYMELKSVHQLGMPIQINI